MSDRFKHISVTAGEDDDEVIIAGAVNAPHPEATDDSAATSTDAQVPEKQVVRPSEKTEPRNARKAPQDGYRETTLADLEGEKMPTMQKVVIVAAIICIIGALVYYFVAMR